jgi:predicted ester cyclase
MHRDKQVQQRRIVHQIFAQGWNEADFEGIETWIAADAKFHFRQRTHTTSADDLRRIVTGWHRAFAGFRFTIEDMVVEGDLVAVRLALSGTHRGQWQDIPATGMEVHVTAMMFLRFADGQVVEIWEDYDEHGMRKQLVGAP